MTKSNDTDSQNELNNLSSRAFSAHVTKLRKRHGLSAEIKIKKENFESLDDLDAFMAHYDSAETYVGKPIAAMSRQTRITRATSTKTNQAIAKALDKKKVARAAQRARKAAQPSEKAKRTPKARKPNPSPKTRSSKPAVRARKGKSAPPPVSSLMEPGRYNSDPWRLVGLKHLPREIEASNAQFRRTKRGLGKCTGSKLKDVSSAFTSSYYYAESARQEVAAILKSPDYELLWHASRQHKEASLAFWFGADYSPRQIKTMLVKIEGILTEWSRAHCGGFRGLLPVWIRCKSKNGVGGGPARHLVANMIELFPRYFNMSKNKRYVTMLHEMGHRSTGLVTPRDERHDLCQGGWNRKENMCYRDHNDVDEPSTGHIFIGGNPRELAIAAENGNTDARKTALNNIDNYVCYMWNRHKDHKSQMIYLLSPNAKEPKRPARDSKPASKPK